MKSSPKGYRKPIKELADVDYNALMDYTYCYQCGDRSYSDHVESNFHTSQLMEARGYDMWELVIIEKAWRNLVFNGPR